MYGACLVWMATRSLTGTLVATTTASAVRTCLPTCTTAGTPPSISSACEPVKMRPPSCSIAWASRARYLSGWNCPWLGKHRHGPVSNDANDRRAMAVGGEPHALGAVQLFDLEVTVVEHVGDVRGRHLRHAAGDRA